MRFIVIAGSEIKCIRPRAVAKGQPPQTLGGSVTKSEEIFGYAKN
jgi:hypothetical protein